MSCPCSTFCKRLSDSRGFPETIISSSTHREDGFDDLFVDRIIDQLRKGSTMGSGQKAPSSAIEMSHFLLGSCVDFINSLTWKDVCRGADDQIQKDASSKPVLLFYADSLNKAVSERDQHVSQILDLSRVCCLSLIEKNHP